MHYYICVYDAVELENVELFFLDKRHVGPKRSLITRQTPWWWNCPTKFWRNDKEIQLPLTNEAIDFAKEKLTSPWTKVIQVLNTLVFLRKKETKLIQRRFKVDKDKLDCWFPCLLGSQVWSDKTVQYLKKTWAMGWQGRREINNGRKNLSLFSYIFSSIS